jgi:hypothetical protein
MISRPAILLPSFAQVPAFFSILGLALLAGSYTIYGGLISVAWTDFLQFDFLNSRLSTDIMNPLGLHVSSRLVSPSLLAAAINLVGW